MGKVKAEEKRKQQDGIWDTKWHFAESNTAEAAPPHTIIAMLPLQPKTLSISLHR